MSPMSILVLLLEIFGIENYNHAHYLGRDLQQAEERTGFWEEIDSSIAASEYEQLNKEVYSVRLRLTNLRRVTDFQEQFGQFLHSSINVLDRLRAEHGMSPVPKWRRTNIVQDLEYQMTTCRRLQDELEIMQERVQIQVDVVGAVTNYEYTRHC